MRLAEWDGPSAIILGGSANAVSVARSLAAAGVRVTAIGNRSSRVRYSRHATFVDLGAGGNVQAPWLDWLRSNLREGVLLPCDDEGLELVARHREELVNLGYIPIEAHDERLLAMLDKARTYELAGEAGVRAPNTFVVTGIDDLASIDERLLYPSAVKPVHSHRAQRAGLPVKAYVAGDAGELQARVSQLLNLGLEALVTEIVLGGDDCLYGYYTYVDEHGTPLFEHTKQKLRQYPTGFGLGCYQITCWDPQVAAAGRRFVQGSSLRGLVNVEFKRDIRDGDLRIIECNHRFTACNEQLRIAGRRSCVVHLCPSRRTPNSRRERLSGRGSTLEPHRGRVLAVRVSDSGRALVWGLGGEPSPSPAFPGLPVDRSRADDRIPRMASEEVADE